FRALLGSVPFTAELMEHGSTTHGNTQAKGVCNLLRQRHRLLALRQLLVRIAQEPQRPGAKAVAHHTRVIPMQERRGTMLLGVVECNTLRKMRVRSGSISQHQQRRSQGTMRR